MTRKHLLRSSLVVTTFALAFAPSARAFTIVVDYTYDTNDYFANTTAKAALEAAAADLSAVLTNTLGAVPSDIFTGTNGDTTATFNWNLAITHPTNGSTVTFNSFALAANEYRVFVGAQLLSGATLGQGGPGSAGFSLNGSGFSSEWVGAMAAAESASNAALSRGSGAVIGSFSGGATLGDTTANYNLQHGLTYGNLWFDTDADWHFDHTTAVGAGKSDFYSVALHEIIHSLGAGGSVSWTANHSGTTWLGAEAVAENGTGVGLLNPSQDHLASGTISATALGGANQEVVMSPTITTGTRKCLTELDLAMLRDLGFETASPVPEPASAAALAALAALAFGATRRRRRS